MTIPNSMPTMNFDLGETADQLRDTVRSFTADEIAARVGTINYDIVTSLLTRSERVYLA